MKTISRTSCTILIAVLGLSVPCSCTREEAEEPEEGIVLTVSSAGNDLSLNSTKSGEGQVDWNENKIESVYYFIYKEGVHDQAPVLKGFFAGLNLNGANPTKTWSIPVSSKTILEDLFPSGTQKCHAFIVANPKGSLVNFLEGDASSLTLDNLHKYSFYSSLDGVQDSFIMTYEGDVDLISRTGGTNKVVARINAELKRLAVKLSIHAKVVPDYQDPVSGVWTPETNGLRASFNNALSLTNLAGDFSLLSVHQSDYFNTTEAGFSNKRDASFKNTSGETVNGTVMDTSAPMYSYPMKWEFADRDEPYIFVELPWTRRWTDANGNHQNTQSCYYKIMFSLKRVDANQWYDVTITLDALGSFNKVEPTQQYLYEDYMVLDWNDAYDYEQTNVNADVKEARYLAVDSHEYMLYDQEVLSIPFSSSHQISLSIKSATQENLKTNTPNDCKSTASSWFSVSTTGSVIEFEHHVNNTVGTGMDITPFDITLTVEHEDDSSYKEEIHIVQYPAISVSKTLNSAVTKNGSNFTKSDVNGYVWINNAQNSPGENGTNEEFAVLGNSYMNASNFGTGTNNCPYIYEIQVKALSDDKYRLNDPRTTQHSNLDYSFSNAPSLDPGNRTLTYYYQTMTDAEEADKTISPKFKIASSFGKTWNLNYSEAVRRCAAYQEDGYPAGRWRVPTYSEIEFCLSLSNYGLIEVLFGSDSGDSNYWYSTGYATIKSNGTSIAQHPGTSGSNEYAVRCVYDSWYWDEVDRAAGRTEEDRLNRRTIFTWGDKLR